MRNGEELRTRGGRVDDRPEVYKIPMARMLPIQGQLANS